MKVKPKILLFSLFLIALLTSIISFQTTRCDSQPILKERGRNFEKIYFSNGSVLWRTTFTAVWNGSHWVNYIFSNESGVYTVQAGMIGAKIYPGYAEFYDSNMSMVYVARERWIVWRYSSILHKWLPVLLQSEVSFKSSNVVMEENYVNVTNNYSNLYGNLTITYHFYERLKHSVSFTAKVSGRYRITQLWRGIVFESVKLENGTTINLKLKRANVTLTKSDSALFIFYNETQPFSLFEDQRGTTNFDFAIVGTFTFNSYNRTGALYIFNNQTLAEGEILTIDPTTYTGYPGASENDGYVEGSASDYFTARSSATGYDTSHDFLSIGQSYISFEGTYYVYRTFLKFDTSSIPSSATITSATLKLYGKDDVSNTDFYIRIQKWTDDTPINTGDFNEFDGVNYDDGGFSTSSFTTSGYNTITISDYSIINKGGYTRLCLRSSRDIGSNTPSQPEYVNVYSYDYGTGYYPTLEVTYTTNNPPDAPTLDSPSADERFDIGESVTFTWIFNDPDSGDSQSAYQFQLDDNSDFSSPIIDTGKVSSSSTSTTQTLPSTVGKYYWRVKTWDSHNAESPWSSGRVVIAERIQITLTVSDNRIDVGSTMPWSFTATYEYDGTDATSYVSVTLNDTTTKSDVGLWYYTVSSITETQYGLTVFTSNTISCIFDRVVVTLSVSDNRINVGENATININAVYDYDDSSFIGSITLNDTQTTKSTVGKYWFTVSSISDSQYGLTVYTSNTVYVIWDKDVMEDLSFSGGTMFNFSARVKSLYDGYFNNRNVRVKVYLNGTLVDSYDVVSDANGYISFTYTHNLYGHGTLGFEVIDLDYDINSDNYTSYEVNYSVNGLIGDLTISPLLYYPGDTMSISIMFKSNSYINDTYLKLNNIYFRPVFCYPDGTVYGADLPFDLFNGTKANEWEYKDESLTIMLPDGVYVLKIQLYIKGSDYLLDEYDSPSFQVLAIGGGPSGEGGGGGAPTINTQALIVKVNDEKGTPLSAVRVEIYDKYGGLVANKTTNEWGELTLTLYEGTYTVVAYYEGLNQTKTVTLSDEPLTVQFSFPFKVVITPTEIFLDANSILMFILGAIGIAVALYLNSRGFVIPVIFISFISVASFITGALIGLRMMPPLITLPSFSLPSVSAPSFDISFLIDFLTSLFGQIQNAVSGVFSLDLRGMLIISIIVLGISAAYLSHKAVVMTKGRRGRRPYYRRRLR